MVRQALEEELVELETVGKLSVNLIDTVQELRRELKVMALHLIATENSDLPEGVGTLERHTPLHLSYKYCKTWKF